MYYDAVRMFVVFFFFNDTATTEIYTLSLHDALPTSMSANPQRPAVPRFPGPIATTITSASATARAAARALKRLRSEEHTSELQSRPHLVCRLLLEKKKNMTI